MKTSSTSRILLIRTLVSIVLAIFAICYLFFVPLWLFKVISYLLFLVCVYEYTNVTKLTLPLLYLFSLSALISFDLFFTSWTYGLGIMLFTLCVGLFLLLQNNTITYKHLLTILLWLALPWGMLLQRATDSHLQLYYTILILAMIITSDSAAYLGGTFFGKHKLAPSISPNKTIEGSLIGLSSALVVTLLIRFFLSPALSFIALAPFIIIVIITTLVGQMGDLFESKWKRIYSVKDSGKFLPEHGGMLDRIDAYLFAVPVFMLLLYFFRLPLH